MARATPEEVSDELNGALAPSEILQQWLDRAHILVEDRKPAGASEELLEQAEILAASHYSYSAATGVAQGRDVVQVEEGDASVRYKSVSVGPDGVESPFWGQAVELAPWLDDDPDEFVFTTL